MTVAPAAVAFATDSATSVTVTALALWRASKAVSRERLLGMGTT